MNSRPLNILHTEWSDGWGGQEIRVHAESLAMRERGHQVMLACRRDSQLFEKATASGLEVKAVAFNSPINPATILRLASLMKRHEIEVVHTHSSVDSWCAGFAGRLAGVPVVRGRHLSSPVKSHWSTRLLYNRLAHAVITSGETIRRHLIDDVGCDAARICSIPAGADEKRFRPGLDGAAVRRELGIPAEAKVIGIVAVLRSWKGHTVLMEAFAPLAAADSSLRLLIVGDGPGREHFRERIKNFEIEKSTILTGHRSDVPEVMSAMDLLVLPSLKNEATSQVIPQAMLVGIPVVASTAGGLTEVVRDGETGLSVPPGDAVALREALRRMLSDPALAAKLAHQGRESALASFTFRGMIEKTEAVYREVLKRQ